jgi:hypothetical protein
MSPSIMARARAAYTKSLLVRSLVLGTVAIGVTVAGIAAGALIVAPVVASATRVEAPTSAAPGRSTVASVQSAAASAWNRLDAGTASVLARLPEPVARYALPTVAVASLTGALLALFLPSRESARQPAPLLTASLRTPARSAAPLGTGRVSNKKRTPSAVEALAASGASAPDIARRTGLPLDAVQLLLTISNGPRQFHPHSA